MVVDLSPLLRGARGETIRVAGVCAGEAAMKIDRRALTGAHERMFGEGPPAAPQTMHRLTSDGPVELPLAERIDAVLQQGGWLWCGDVALSVKQGSIERVFVRGPALASLDIASEASIARRFGPATGYERVYRDRLHHYVERGLIIAWHDGERRVAYVALGLDGWREPQLGARELLAEILGAFRELSRANWAEPADGPTRLRYQRIDALARALGLGGIADLTKGKFLEGELGDARRAVLREIAAQDSSVQKPVDESTAMLLFNYLLGYRHDVHWVVNATSGWLCCGDPALLGMIATQDRLGRQFEAMMADIDRWLCTLMDPEQRTFALQTLISRYGWPDVDIRTIEMDEL
jgi:hypothetical protein